MTGHAACEQCDAQIEFSVPAKSNKHDCPVCGTELELVDTGDDPLESCLVCGEQDFYRNSEINPSFGIFMVGACFVGFLGFVYFMPGMRGFLLGAAVLLTGAVMDRLLRIVLPEAAICYHCKSVYTGVPNIKDFHVHDQEKRADIEQG